MSEIVLDPFALGLPPQHEWSLWAGWLDSHGAWGVKLQRGPDYRHLQTVQEWRSNQGPALSPALQSSSFEGIRLWKEFVKTKTGTSSLWRQFLRFFKKESQSQQHIYRSGRTRFWVEFHNAVPFWHILKDSQGQDLIVFDFESDKPLYTYARAQLQTLSDLKQFPGPRMFGPEAGGDTLIWVEQEKHGDPAFLWAARKWNGKKWLGKPRLLTQERENISISCVSSDGNWILWADAPVDETVESLNLKLYHFDTEQRHSKRVSFSESILPYYIRVFPDADKGFWIVGLTATKLGATHVQYSEQKLVNAHSALWSLNLPPGHRLSLTMNWLQPQILLSPSGALRIAACLIDELSDFQRRLWLLATDLSCSNDGLQRADVPLNTFR